MSYETDRTERRRELEAHNRELKRLREERDEAIRGRAGLMDAGVKASERAGRLREALELVEKGLREERAERKRLREALEGALPFLPPFTREAEDARAALDASRESNTEKGVV